MKIPIILLICFSFHASHAQATTQVNTIRDLAIAMKLAFENMEKQRRADREYLEKLIQANKESLEKLIQANKEALEKRIAFLENLMIALITIVITQLGYTIWSDRKERQLPKAKLQVTETIATEQLQQLLKRVEELEKRQLVNVKQP